MTMIYKYCYKANKQYTALLPSMEVKRILEKESMILN